LLESIKEEEAKQKAKREVDRKRAQTENAIGGKQSHNLDTEDLRKQLGGEGWEIDHEQLEFTQLIGKGTSGSVFAGLFGTQPVAIKVLSTSNIEQELVEFKKEFKILLKLNSEYMIKFYGAVVEKYLMMVMELCERGSLYDVLLKVTVYSLVYNCVLILFF
jgi:serine/threonine protein kinase